MSDDELRRAIHDLDVTVWVGKGGPSAVVDELESQLGERSLVKVKFLRAARGSTTAEKLAGTLAERTGAEVVDVRGHTAVLRAP